ncbi:hypothetical protein H0H92_010194 [Tricholoma furcatifolium]|nr:hypothetical protein H0H92_010194 [Tricholoma furcatifolium]
MSSLSNKNANNQSTISNVAGDQNIVIHYQKQAPRKPEHQAFGEPDMNKSLSKYYNQIGKDTDIGKIDLFYSDSQAENQILLSKLDVAKEAGRDSSKACLTGTRVSLLERIKNWALDPSGERTLLLSGAAGKVALFKNVLHLS